MIVLSLLLFLLVPLPTWAAEYLGLFHTVEEVNIWRERAAGTATHNYRTTGDVQTNSPGDWARIEASANAFLADPDADRYLGTGGTCPTTQSAGPFGGGSFGRGGALQDAAFAWVITGETTYRAAALAELLVHAAAGGLAWGNDTLFGCVEFTGAVTLPWNSLMVKYVIAYSFLRPDISSGDRATLDAWFLAYGQRMEESVHSIAVKRFPGRKSGNYTVDPDYTTCNNTPKLLYVDSAYTSCDFHDGWSNTILFGALGFGLVGVMLDDATLKTEAKRFFEEHTRYTQFPDNTQGETHRWNGGDPLHGMSYSGLVLVQLALLAEAFARNGDPALYDYTSSGGHLTSAGGTKGLEASILEYQNRVNGTRSIYADSVTANNKLDADMEACCGWSTVNDVIAGAIVSRYYGGTTIKQNYLRQSGGPAYSTSLNANCGSGGGSSTVWKAGDAWCLLPGALFMFGQMEGLVDPYTPNEGETVENLLTVANMVPGTCSACASNRPWSALLDGDVTTETGSAGNQLIASFQGEHDLGSSKSLENFRAYCDSSGTWQTSHVTFEHKINIGDSYTVAVNHQVCNAEQWFEFPINAFARYVRITFFHEGTACDGTQAREIFLTETPEVLPLPGPRAVIMRGVTWRGGVLR